MIKKTITYRDFNDEERSETFYFNLTRAELSLWNLSVDGGLDSYMKVISEKRNGEQIVNALTTILSKSYGEKSQDGKRLVKGPELYKAFTETRAFDVLVMELLTDGEALATFIDQVLDEDVKKAAPNLRITNSDN